MAGTRANTGNRRASGRERAGNNASAALARASRQHQRHALPVQARAELVQQRALPDAARAFDQDDAGPGGGALDALFERIEQGLSADERLHAGRAARSTGGRGLGPFGGVPGRFSEAQRGAERRGAGGPVAWRLSQRQLDGGAQPRGKVGPDQAQGAGRIVQDGQSQPGAAVGAKGGHAPQHLVDDRAQRVHVRRGRGFLPRAPSLGRHVSERPHRIRRCFHRRAVHVGAGQDGDAEVQQLHARAFPRLLEHEHVPRLQIPVHDAGVMHGLNGAT
jgi:hypothetical protein